jgi:hypothetical protein
LKTQLFQPTVLVDAVLLLLLLLLLLLVVVLCRLVRPGDRVLLVSCSYEHQPASGPDFFRNYTAVAEKLQVCMMRETRQPLCYATVQDML